MAKAKVSHPKETQKSDQPEFYKQLQRGEEQQATIAKDLDESLNKLTNVNEAMIDLSWMMTEWKPESIPTQRQMHPTAIVNLLSDCYEEVAKDLREIWRRANKGGAA